MALALPLHGVSCFRCGGDVVYYWQEEASGWKVFAECDGCDHDFGKCGTVPMSEVEGRDEADERAKEIARTHVEAMV